MKLISCHIENFGKLQDYSADFSDGVNVICKENGWGKSTLAAFIRAMFYGLEGERRRSLQDNERRRYKPWQGGVFGGQLVFETSGKTYQITRIFQDKEANDTFELRDAKTNLPSKDYSKRIGEELFKIDRESFLRTVFITQSACETAATDDINAKIGNLSDNTHDLNNFDTASTRLTDMLNRLTPKRATGSLSKRREQIAAYERLVQGGQSLSASIDAYRQQLQAEQDAYEACKLQQQNAAKRQEELAKQHTAAAAKSEWSRLQKAVQARTEEAVQARRELPGQLLSAEEIKNKVIACTELEKGQERSSLYKLTPEEEAERSALSEAFSGGIPEDIDDKIEEATKLRDLEQELNAKRLTAAEKEQLSRLEADFADEAEPLTELAAAWHKRGSIKAALSSKAAALQALQTAQKQRARRVSPLAAAGVIVILLGAVLAFAVKMSIGVILAAVGGVLLLMGLVGNKKQPSPELTQLQQEVEEDRAFIGQTDARMAAYFERHGRVFAEDTVDAALQELTMESLEYASLKKKAAQEPDPAEAQRTREALTAWLSGYGMAAPEDRLQDALYELRKQAARFSFLQDKYEHWQTERAAYETGHQELTEFLRQSGYQPRKDLAQQLREIQELTGQHRMAARLQAEAETELKEFEEKHDPAQLAALPDEAELPSLEAVNEQIQQLTDQMQEAQNRISDYRKTLADLQEKQEEQEENSAQLQQLKEIQLAEQEKYAAVSMAKEKLILAKEAMTARYADPIRRAFGMYYEKISGEPAEAFHVDANTNVTVDEFGKQREIAALSAGYRDLIGVCLRIALVDAMYQEEVPVLIMDDPFTNLDDEKNAAAAAFLKEIAEKYQVIYFTCSTKREMNIIQ
ncbi:MAG: AAA family ATPase [Lachnospiraceae bacterium]|jgi:DNA repair exonuclease SbcCD ATPase subunit|nr:AAA family ATPase [Lachnospiraceae bacterium]